MTAFEFGRSDYLNDRAFVEVDDKYSVVIIRTDEGIIIDVYPKDWDAPIDTMGVHDHDVAQADSEEAEAAAAPVKLPRPRWAGPERRKEPI